MVKKKIVYLNPNSFTDTDITIVKHLKECYDIYWFVIRNQSDAYSKKFYEDYARDNNLSVNIYDYTCRRRSIKFLLLMLKVVRDISKIKPQLLFTCVGDLYFFILKFFYLFKLKMVIGIHDVKTHSNMKYPIFLSLSRNIVLHFGSDFVLYSNNQYELFKKLYPQKRAFYVGMSYKDFGEPNEPKVVDAKRKILFFGTLLPYKGCDLLIKAFEELLSEGIDNLHLTFYGKFGNSDYEKLCMKSIKTVEFYNLNFNFVPNEKVANVFSTHDVSVFPYRDATQSGPLMINLRYGLPIIAPCHTCFSDIYTNGTNSILYNDSNDVNDIKRALLKLSRMSDAEFKQMERNAKCVSELYAEQVIAERYFDAFNQILP